MGTQYDVITALADVVLVAKTPEPAPGLKLTERGPGFDREGLVIGDDACGKLNVALGDRVKHDAVAGDSCSTGQCAVGRADGIIGVGGEAVAMGQLGRVLGHGKDRK